jgi:exosome complex component RRP41
MAYKKRHDGRKMDETRPIVAKAGVIRKADGSGYFKIGDTEAYAAVYGPRELHPRKEQNPKKGKLRCTYNMMPFSGQGDRVRPGPSRRSKEISMVMEKALEPVLDLEQYPNAVVDVFVELPQTDAGSRCAAISAASIALADAGLKMRDMVAAVAVGMVDGSAVVDLDYKEEAWEEGHVADIPLAVVPSTGEISLIQMDGRVKKEELSKAIKLGMPAFAKIADVQRQAIKDRFAEATKEALGKKR